MATLFFSLMVGFLIAHELDAVKRHEWRLLPFISLLPEKTAEQVFIWAHIPLMAGVAWISGQGAQSGGAIALSVFAVLHVGLHWLFRKHPANEFDTVGSWWLIAGAGGFGTAHIMVVF